MGYKLFYLCSRNQEMRGWTNSAGEWWWRVGFQSFGLRWVLRNVALVGFWKKTSKLFIKKFGVNEKVPIFAAAFWNEADVLKHFDGCVFHLFRLKPAEAFFYGGSEKKVWKKVRKDLEGIYKSIYLYIRFRLMSGAGKREAKEFLKILKGLKTNSKCESANKFDGYNDWAKEILFKVLLLWRVWSWLRMNASDRLNTCKSRGIMR